MIKYIGSKRLLIPDILDAIRSFGPKVRSVVDLFSGTSRVGHALKAEGFQVHSNDHNSYAHTLATCYVQADLDVVTAQIERLIREFNSMPGSPGYFTDTFCVRSRFFQPKNGARVDVIREAIARKCLDPEREAILLTSLMEAADRVDSTTGLQMAYLKEWSPRAHKDLEMRMPHILPRAENGKGSSHHLEAVTAAQLEADVAYIDPPYNQHSYLGNYHIWESLVRWDKPKVYGVACKREDVRERKSGFNSKRCFHQELRCTIEAVRAPRLVVSFNDEGFITRDDMESLLSSRGRVRTIEKDCKRYVGAQIGIHGPTGEKVGAVGRLRNKEFLFVVEP